VKTSTKAADNYAFTPAPENTYAYSPSTVNKQEDAAQMFINQPKEEKEKIVKE
jgi:hypothetical protein